MINVIELIIFAGSLFLIAYLSVLTFRLRKQTIKLTEKLVQNNIDKNTLFEKFAELKAEQDAKNIAETEGFLKFLSESRQMAFDYISDVQDAIAEYLKALENEDLASIAVSLDKLKALLPKNEDSK